MAQLKYLGFPIPETLEVKMEKLAATIREAKDKTIYAMDIYNVIAELSDIGLTYFFIAPLQRAKMGGLKIKALEWAIGAGKSGVLSVGKGIIKSMNNDQIMVVVELFEQSLTVRPIDDENIL